MPEKRIVLQPEWWSEAKKLQNEGLNYKQIAWVLSKSNRTVRIAVDPDFRAIELQRYKDYGQYKRKPRANRTERPYEWRKARRQARIEWKANGGDLRDYYKKYGVYDAKSS